MKITRRQLRRIIKEELSRLNEAQLQCKISEWEVTILFKLGESQIITPNLPPNDLICLMVQGMESDRDFIEITAGTSGSPTSKPGQDPRKADLINQKVMLERIASAQNEVSGYLEGVIANHHYGANVAPVSLPYSIREIWNKAKVDTNFSTIMPGDVIGGKYQVPTDPNDPYFEDMQFVKIKITTPIVTPNVSQLVDRFMKATLEMVGTDEDEVYTVLTELRDAKDFYAFNRALFDTHGKNFYTIACSRGWHKRQLNLPGLGPTTVLPGGPTEIGDDDTTVAAHLQRLGVQPLKC
jgi:hypothetical protein